MRPTVRTGGPLTPLGAIWGPAEVDLDQVEDEDTTLVIGSWRYAGMGWLTTGDATLAMASAARARDDQL